MKGRQETEKTILRRLDKFLNEIPELKGYMDYLLLSGKAHYTVNAYVRGAYKYLKYLNTNSLQDVKNSNLDSFIRFIDGDRMRYYEIRHFYHYLVINKYADKNMADYIDAPKDKNEHKVVSLTMDEIQKIKKNIFEYDPTKQRHYEAMKNRDYAVVMLALTTGLRIGSIIELNVEDLNFDTGELTITEKGNKTRTIYLTDEMLFIIKEYLKDRETVLKLDKSRNKSVTNALFISRNKKRLSYPRVNEMLKTYTKGINKKITPHKLRSTCATILYDNTQDIMIVKDTLGHQDVKTTMRYIGASEQRLKKSSSVMGNLLLK